MGLKNFECLRMRCGQFLIKQKKVFIMLLTAVAYVSSGLCHMCARRQYPGPDPVCLPRRNVADIADGIKTQSCIMYADDVKLYVCTIESAALMSDDVMQLQAHLDRLLNWCHIRKPRLNPDKFISISSSRFTYRIILYPGWARTGTLSSG